MPQPGVTAVEITGLIKSSNPTLSILTQKQNSNASEYTINKRIGHIIERKDLMTIIEILLGDNSALMKPDLISGKGPDTDLANRAFLIRENLSNCRDGLTAAAEDAMVAIGERAVALLSAEDQAPLWEYMANTECLSGAFADENLVNWHKLFTATYRRDYAKMSQASSWVLAAEKTKVVRDRTRYALSIGMLGDLMQGDTAAASQRWATYGGGYTNENIDLPMRLLLASAGFKLAAQPEVGVQAEADL